MCPPSDEYIVQLENGEILVHRKGKGKQLLIALHGFESNGQAFSCWETVLGEQYTICSPDLPFHGQSTWRTSKFTPTDIEELILAIAKKEDISTFTLVGFSMGGRLSICVGKNLKNHVDRFIFLAPAGIGNYDKVPPVFFQNIAEFLLHWPGWFKLGTVFFFKLGWISRFQKRYAEVQIFPKDHRFRFFRIFNSILNFSTSRPDITHFWTYDLTETLIVLATRDRMVSNDKIRHYFSQHPNSEIIEIDTKHELETVEVAEIIKNWRLESTTQNH